MQLRLRLIFTFNSSHFLKNHPEMHFILRVQEIAGEGECKKDKFFKEII